MPWGSEDFKNPNISLARDSMSKWGWKGPTGAEQPENPPQGGGGRNSSKSLVLPVCYHRALAEIQMGLGLKFQWGELVSSR